LEEEDAAGDFGGKGEDEAQRMDVGQRDEGRDGERRMKPRRS
jgi:hypothetical protein